MNFKEYIKTEPEELNEGGRWVGKYTKSVGKLNRASKKVLDAIDAHDEILMDFQDETDKSYPDPSIKKFSTSLKDARMYYQMSEEYTRK